MKYVVFYIALIGFILSSCTNNNNSSIPSKDSYDIRLDIEAKSSDYIPKGDYIIAHTGLIGGGETSVDSFYRSSKRGL